MVRKSSWEVFRRSGLLWWVNRTLHLFGWAIVYSYDNKRKLVDVYPARCKFRGFHERGEAEGFTRLTKHLNKRMPQLLKDIKL